jgi:hypothetical protein
MSVSDKQLSHVINTLNDILRRVSREFDEVKRSLYNIERAVAELSSREFVQLTTKTTNFIYELENSIADAIDDYIVSSIECDPNVEKYITPSSTFHDVCVVTTDTGKYVISTDLQSVWLFRL